MLQPSNIVELPSGEGGLVIAIKGRRNNKFELEKIKSLIEELGIEIFQEIDKFVLRELYLIGEREKLSFLLFLLAKREEQLAEMEVMYSI